MTHLGLLKNQLPNRFIFRQMLEWIIRRPVVTILAVAIITAFFAWHLPKLTFTASIYDLVIEDLPETARYHSFKETFGSEEIIQIVIKSEDVFADDTFRKIALLSDAVSRIEGIRRVISLSKIKKEIDVSDKWSNREFATLLSHVRMFRNNLFSEDHRTTALTLVLRDDVEKEGVIRAVEDLIRMERNDLSLYQVGMPLISQALARYTEKDFFRLLPLCFLLISVILFLLFRRISWLFLPLICVSISLVWTFGLMALVSVSLSMLTMIVPVFIIAVGTAYYLHIHWEFLSLSKVAQSAEEAVLETFSNMTLPTMLAVFTTGIGIGSLLVTRITAIREFAIFSCFGLISLLIILLTLLPSALVLIPFKKDRYEKDEGYGKPFGGFLSWITRINITYQRVTLSSFIVIMILCIIGIFRVQVETNPVEYFKRDTPVSRHFHDIYKDLAGSFPVNVVMEHTAEDYFERPQNISQIARLQTFLEGLPGVDKTLSFVDYMKLVNYTMNRFDPQYYALPEEDFEIRILINNYKTILGEDMLSAFMNTEFSKANILLLTHISSSKDLLHLREKVLVFVKTHLPEDLNWDVTGLGIVISASSHHLTSGQIRSLSLTMALVFLTMVILFLSFKVGVVAIATNFFPVMVNFGVMGWFGIELSIMTALIACLAIGLAVDDTIHYLVRYNREFKKDLDKDRALSDSIRSVGRPIISTTLIISIGFSALIFSGFKPTAIFGILMVVTMISALIGDLIVLPSLMLHVELVTAWDLLRLMPSLGGMSPGIAHELNQPLNAIKMGSEFLKIMLGRGARIKEEDLSQVAIEISQQVDRASEIIHRLSEFGRKEEFAKEEVDVNHPIRDTLAIIGNQLNLDNITLETDLDENIPPILAHKNRLEQVMYNLIINASEAIRVKMGGADGKELSKIKIRTYQESGWVVVSVFDTGIGIPAHLRDRIFEPFYTSKESGKGKGLGLSITHEIVRDYGGRITIESEKRVGTTFRLLFPALRESTG